MDLNKLITNDLLEFRKLLFYNENQLKFDQLIFDYYWKSVSNFWVTEGGGYYRIKIKCKTTTYVCRFNKPIKEKQIQKTIQLKSNKRICSKGIKNFCNSKMTIDKYDNGEVLKYLLFIIYYYSLLVIYY